MKTITEKDYELLKTVIGDIIKGTTMYDDNGNPITFGMGEMNECNDAAEFAANEWIEKAGIIVLYEQ